MTNASSYIVVAQHRIGTALSVATAFVCVTAFCAFVVDVDSVSLRWIRPLWIPINVIGACMGSWILFCWLRSRGKALVGGPGWIAEYRYMSLRPLKGRVRVDDASRLKLRVRQEVRPPSGAHLKGWVELVVVDHKEREIVWTVANPKWLKEGFEEEFDRWKELSLSEKEMILRTGEY